jgi:hypothetical protein
MKTLILLSLLSLPALAEEPKAILLDEGATSSELDKRHDVQKAIPPRNILPDRAEREQFFADNWKDGMKDYDELEKDLLYMDLKSKTILELKSKYPELSPKELEELKTKRK